MAKKARGKILNIASHWGNANQNHDLISSHNWKNVYHQKEHKLVGKDVEKREPFCTVVGSVNRCGHCGKQYGDFIKN